MPIRAFGPAEALLLAQPRLHHPFEFISYTLAELIMLGVVQVETRRVQVHPSNPARVVYHFLQKGPHFESFAPLPSQELLLKRLRIHPEYPLHLLAKSLRSDWVTTDRDFVQNYVKSNLVKAGLMSPHMHVLVHLYLPNRRGGSVRSTLWRDMFWLRRGFPLWLTQQPEKALRVFAFYGPILLMMPGLDFATLAEMPDAWREVSYLRTIFAHQADGYHWQGVEHLPDFGQLRWLDTWLKTLESAYSFRLVNEDGDPLIGTIGMRQR